MKIKLCFIFLLILLFFFCSLEEFSSAQTPPPQGQQKEEQLTITTYYPSPYGVYKEVRLSPLNEPPSICTANTEGTLYYDYDDGQIMVCRESSRGYYNWQNLRSTGGDGIMFLGTDQFDVNQYPGGPGFVNVPPGGTDQYPGPDYNLRLTPTCAGVGPQENIGCPGWQGIFNLWFMSSYSGARTTESSYVLDITHTGWFPFLRADNASCRVMYIQANVSAAATATPLEVTNMIRNYREGCYPCPLPQNMPEGYTCVAGRVCDPPGSSCPTCPYCGYGGDKTYPCTGFFTHSVMCREDPYLSTSAPNHLLNADTLPAACPIGWREADCRKTDSVRADAWPGSPTERSIGNFVRTCYKCDD